MSESKSSLSVSSSTISVPNLTPAGEKVRQQLGSVGSRRAKNKFHADEGQSHIEVTEAMTPEAAEMLIKICPAHVYYLNESGKLQAEYVGCFECGTCLAVAPPGSLKWHEPEGGCGIRYRQG